jgi:serine/threonine-protein kinase
MPVTSLREFADALQKTRILTAAQQEQLTREVGTSASDVRALARRLLDRGWLTSYQVNQLVLGRGAELLVGSYLLLERLGEGGTGQVFTARHVHMNRVVAFKLIRKDLLADREVVGRFHREIQLVSSLTHPNVVHAYDAGPIGDGYYLAMEHVEGTDLARRVREKGALPVQEACDYIRQAAQGLHHIHERSLVHRDIKPGNLLVTTASAHQEAGVIKILDLGLARLHRPANGELTNNLTTTNPVMMGTLDYMAPEQALDFHAADIRADIYSLGCTFYYLLTAQAPFPDGTLAQKLMRHQQTEPVPVEKLQPAVPAGVAAVVRRMMAKQPQLRFQVPGEIVAALCGGGETRVRGFLPALVMPTVRLPSAVTARMPLRGEIVYPAGAGQPRPLLEGLLHSARQPEILLRRPWVLVAGLSTVAFFGLLVFAGLLYATWPSHPSVAAAPPPNATRSTPTPSPAPTTAAVTVPALSYLSDLAEENVQASAFGKNGHLNHNGNGNLGVETATARIIVKGIQSKKGLSTLAPTGGSAIVTYHLGRRYTAFKSGVALHDGGWFSGSTVTFTIMGDGKILWQSKPIRTKEDQPQDCSISVSGVDVLELQVTCSSNNSGVWPVWLDPSVSK